MTYYRVHCPNIMLVFPRSIGTSIHSKKPNKNNGNSAAFHRHLTVYLPPENIAALDAGKRRHLYSVTGKEQYCGGLEQRLTH
jgi:hypothetical protein